MRVVNSSFHVTMILHAVDRGCISCSDGDTRKWRRSSRRHFLVEERRHFLVFPSEQLRTRAEIVEVADRGLLYLLYLVEKISAKEDSVFYSFTTKCSF